MEIKIRKECPSCKGKGFHNPFKAEFDKFKDALSDADTYLIYKAFFIIAIAHDPKLICLALTDRGNKPCHFCNGTGKFEEWIPLEKLANKLQPIQ